MKFMKNQRHIRFIQQNDEIVPQTASTFNARKALKTLNTTVDNVKPSAKVKHLAVYHIVRRKNDA